MNPVLELIVNNQELLESYLNTDPADMDSFYQWWESLEEISKVKDDIRWKEIESECRNY